MHIILNSLPMCYWRRWAQLLTQVVVSMNSLMRTSIEFVISTKRRWCLPCTSRKAHIQLFWQVRSRGYTGKQVLSLENASHTNCAFTTTARRRGMLISDANPKRTWQTSETDKMWSCELQIQSSSSTKLPPTALFSNMLAIVRFSSTPRYRTLKQLNAPVVNILNNTLLIWINPVQHAVAVADTTKKNHTSVPPLDCGYPTLWRWYLFKFVYFITIKGLSSSFQRHQKYLGRIDVLKDKDNIARNWHMRYKWQ